MIDLVVHRRAHGANAERAASGGSPARPSRPPVSRAHAGVAKAGKAGACDPAAVSRPAAALCPAFARLLPRARRGPPPETHSGRFRPQRILLYRLLWRLVKRTAGRRAERRRRESARDRPLCPARARSGGRPCRLCGAGALPPERRGATARRHRAEQDQAGQHHPGGRTDRVRGRAKPGRHPGPAPYAQRAGENGRDRRARPHAANTCGGRRACRPPARARGENRPQGSEREVPHPPCPPVWPAPAGKMRQARARPDGPTAKKARAA